MGVPAVPYILGGLAVGSTAVSQRQQRKAARAQRRAAALERRGAELQNVRARRKAVREAMAVQAQTVARGVAIGGGPTSTAVQQNLADIQSTLGSNLAIQTTLEDLSKARLSQLDRASKYGQRASEYGAVANLAITGASLYSSAGGAGAGDQPKLPEPFND